MMRRARLGIVWCSAALAVATICAGQTVPTPSRARRALRIEYANGRTVHEVLHGGHGEFWTPLFPRVPGADTSRDGYTLSALDIALTDDGENLTVRVSLLYGSPHQRRIEVATVRVTTAAPATIDRLRKYGVEPIVLSVADLPPSLLTSPAITCVSALLDVTVEPLGPDESVYRVLAVNRGTKALMGFRFKAYRGDRDAGNGSRILPRLEPLVQPGAQTSTELRVSPPPTNGPQETVQRAEAWDRFEVTAVLWDDGTVEGDRTFASDERMAAEGHRRVLVRVLGLLRRAGANESPATAVDLRARVWLLPVSVTAEDVSAIQAAVGDPRISPAFLASLRPVDRARCEADAATRARIAIVAGMQQVKDAALVDIDAFARRATSDDPAVFGAWLAKMTSYYEAWLARATRWAVPSM